MNDRKEIALNIGCGFHKLPDCINVDSYDVCDPDMVVDLNTTPWPWKDNSVDRIHAWHVMEHLYNWWEAFKECARILKIGGVLDIRVPHDSSSTALGYRDHLQIITANSFHGVKGAIHGTNAEAFTLRDTVSLKMESNLKVPFPQYRWMIKWCPWLLNFCSLHMRNFIWESQYLFRKI